MIADFEDFVTWMFVMVDDIWQQIKHLYQRPGPEPTSCSDSELITVAIVSACRGGGTKPSWCRNGRPIAA